MCMDFSFFLLMIWKCASYIIIMIGQLFISFIFFNLYVLGDIVCHYPKTVMTFVYWYTLYKVIEVHVFLIHGHVYGRRKILYCHYIVNFKNQWWNLSLIKFFKQALENLMCETYIVPCPFLKFGISCKNYMSSAFTYVLSCYAVCTAHRCHIDCI